VKHQTLKVVHTADGSHTLVRTADGISYHSAHGAIAESNHVFIYSGLRYWMEHHQESRIAVLEMGFGTGLNALLTLTASKNTAYIYYEAFDTVPLDGNVSAELNYGNCLNDPALSAVLRQMHDAAWDVPCPVTSDFTLQKRHLDFANAVLTKKFDVVYYDAFDPVAQPELWTANVFGKVRNAMNEGGVLVTYSSKSSVRRALQSAGFRVEKLPGPAGKREIVRAHA